MEKQQELFGGYSEGANRGRPSAAGKALFPEKQFMFSFTYERLILVAIGMIAALAAVFILGFEAGKKTVFIRRPVAQAVVKTAPVSVPAARAPKPYTIRIAALKSKEFMQQEVARLRKTGLPITVIGVNGLYVIQAGEYNDPKDAARDLSALRKVYKDCEIRKR